MLNYLSNAPLASRTVWATPGAGVDFVPVGTWNTDGLTWLCQSVCEVAGGRGIQNVPRGVELTRRTDDVHTWLFVLNHSDEAVDVEVEEPGIDWVRGKEISGSLHLNPLGLATIQLSSARAAPSADFR